MNCSEFLTHYANDLDGSVTSVEMEAIEAHLGSCASCARYRNVLERGATVLRTLPEPELREDFEPRLKHRLYHVDEERVLNAHQSGAPALTVVGIAILLTALAWVPTLRDGAPVVVLEPIVVDRAPRSPSPIRPASLVPLGMFGTKNPADLDDGLWANTLLYEYSALSQRYNQRARSRRADLPDR